MSHLVTDPLHDDVVVSFIEEALDIHIHNVPTAFLHHTVVHPAHGIVGASPWSISIAVLAKERFEHLSQRLRDRLLDHAMWSSSWSTPILSTPAAPLLAFTDFFAILHVFC